MTTKAKQLSTIMELSVLSSIQSLNYFVQRFVESFLQSLNVWNIEILFFTGQLHSSVKYSDTCHHVQDGRVYKGKLNLHFRRKNTPSPGSLAFVSLLHSKCWVSFAPYAALTFIRRSLKQKKKNLLLYILNSGN